MEIPLRVLIVEDSEDDNLLLLRNLRQTGYKPLYKRVETARDLAAALDKEEWDLVITDFVLPGFGGLDALKLVREKNPDIPCIVVSGKITGDTAVSALKAGARDFITKENLSRLGPAVERELSEARGRRELKKVEEQLKESQRRFQEIVETAGEGVWTTDAQGLTTFVNQRMTEIIGYSREELLEKPGLDHCAPEYLNTCEEANKRIAKGLRQNYEVELVRKDGRKVWVRVSGSPLYGEKGQYAGSLGLYTDIATEKVHQEQLTQMLIEGQERERKRIARELHDDTAQSLSLISLELGSLARGQQSCSEEVVAQIADLKSAVDRTVQDVRRFSHELHPAVLDHLGLLPALEQLVEEVNSRGGLKIEMTVQGKESRLSPEKELALFRIAQEALTNIRKHAQATSASIRLQFLKGLTTMVIIDNGSGFDVNQESGAAIARGSLGLLSMQERAHMVKASLQIDSKVNAGTKISVKMKSEGNDIGKFGSTSGNIQ